MPDAPQPPPPRVGSILLQLGFVVVAALLVYGFVSVTKDGELRRVCSPPCYLHPDYLAADRKAPDFDLKDMHGADVKLSSYRGKIVVLNFWTKTCGPCLEEMPDLAELAVILRDRPDVAVITVSTDKNAEDVKPTLQTVLKGEAPFPVLFDPESDVGLDHPVVYGKYGTHLFPETWIIDQRGVIRARFDGGREWNNPMVVSFIDSLREGDYCPVKIDGKHISVPDPPTTVLGKLAHRFFGLPDADHVCQEMAGTSG